MLSIVTFMHYREQVFNLQNRSCGLYCHCKRASNFIWFSIHIRVINFLRNWWDLSPMMSSFVAIKYWFFSNGTFRDKYQSRGADAHLVCGKYCRLSFWTYSCDNIVGPAWPKKVNRWSSDPWRECQPLVTVDTRGSQAKGSQIER